MPDFPALLDAHELDLLLDSDDLDEMRALHDRLSDIRAMLDWRIREIEGVDAAAEERELICDYQHSVLGRMP
jgi:hypothetical protein